MVKKEGKREDRMFDRHEGDLPIKVRVEGSDKYRTESMNNISLGGMSFRSNKNYDSGTPEVKEPHKCEKWEWSQWPPTLQPTFLPIKNLLKHRFKLPT